MKRLQCLLASMIIMSLGLTGCKKSEPVNPGTSDTASETEPVEETTEPETTEETTEEEVVYSAEKVAEDFNAALAEMGYSFSATWDEEYQEYSLGVNFGESEDTSEQNLKDGAYTLASFLPEYMVKALEIYGDPEAEDYIDIFGVGIAYYYIAFDTPDQLASAEVVSYVYNGVLVAQISISDSAE